MPAHGIGTACFIVKYNGKEHVLKVHNCLYCHGEEVFNLISVSQMLRLKTNEITFTAGASRIEMVECKENKSDSMTIGLREADGLYELEVSPLFCDDERIGTLPSWNLTLENDPHLWKESGKKRDCAIATKAPSRLGVWHCKVLSISRKIGLGAQGDYEEHLKEFCESYFVPPSQPPARRTYKSASVGDMAELSLRFMGIGTDRLVQTLKRSRGLNPPSKKKGENVSMVPPLNFPQGKWKTGKTPKVSKGKVQNLHRAGIAEVCFTDTFEVDDNAYRYGQVFVDYRSRFGDIIPIRSRKKVAWSFGEFCCRHYTPLVLVRDNIAENTGGALLDECHRRGVKSAFSTPYKPQQDYAEGYLGRVTMMASFAMVLSGAPVFMWIWAIQCAVFINNITATYFKREQLWATPWELNHGEPFPDASIVMPFGCAALVMLTDEEKGKFKATCAMMIFIHYALDHPLYTYAFYSPRTKRVILRQDCIFLPSTFPMREARTRVGLIPEGDILVTYRSRTGRDENNETSFGQWKEEDPLPTYQDHVTGFSLASPPNEAMKSSPERSSSWPRYRPSHPAFGQPSVVEIPQPWGGTRLDGTCEENASTVGESQLDDKGGGNGSCQNGECKPRTTRPRRTKKTGQLPSKPATRTRVNERWFYEPVVETNTAMIAHPEGRDDEMGDKGKVFLARESFEKLSFNHPNLDLTDQSKSLKCEVVRFSKSSEFPNGFSDDDSGDCLPVNNDKKDENSKNVLLETLLVILLHL